MDAQTDHMMWVRGQRKTSRLFIDLLKKLLIEYVHKQVIDMILDSYVIHSNRQTKLGPGEFGGRFHLHLC
jgi:hypothetical protein